MTIDSEFFALQLEYSRWANERVLNAVRPLTGEELNRDLHNSHGSVLGTLTHLFLSDRVWLSRLQGSPRSTFTDEGESWTLDTLANAWAEVADGWKLWASSGADPQAILAYRSLAGQPVELPIWQVILHVVNHATYHRGQITTLLRQLNHIPVNTDLHTFYLSRR